MRPPAPVVLGAVVLLVLAGLPVPTAGDSSTNRSVIVESCRDITAPGTYTLGANLTVADREACLRITASDVIVDGAGKRIQGTAPGRDGLVVRGASNVTVTNLHTIDLVNGVTFQDVTDGTVTAVTTVRSARTGIWVVDSRRVFVTESRAEQAGFFGIRLGDTAESLVADSVATRSAVGIGVGRASGNRIARNVVADNGIGIEFAGANDNEITGNTVEGNEFGIVLAVSSGNLLADNVVRANVDGIRLDEADGNRLLSNQLVDNEFGLYLARARRNTVRGNAVHGGRVGIELTLSSDGNAITRNAIVTQATGIRETASGENVITENAIVVAERATRHSPTSPTDPSTAPDPGHATGSSPGGLTGRGLGLGLVTGALGLIAALALAVWSTRARFDR